MARWFADPRQDDDATWSPWHDAPFVAWALSLAAFAALLIGVQVWLAVAVR